MPKNRLEAFSDGVLAIIITIMVLELRPPHGTSVRDLLALAPHFGSYVLSFVYLGIYWNNHHHLLQASQKVNGAVLWANLHLLFWLSLLPFATGWMATSLYATGTVMLYDLVLLMAGVAYFILSWALVRHHGQDSALAKAVGRDRKGRMSVLAYAVAIPLTLVSRWSGLAIPVGVALVWLIPDRRIERNLP